MRHTPAIAIHGGAGTILPSELTPELERQYGSALQNAVSEGFEILRKGGSALDAVCMATVVLEDCDLFNAGKGSVFTSTGEHEMDASVMNGADRKAGAVSGIKNIKNPILLAKKVMEDTSHVHLAGEGAMEFARTRGFTPMPRQYFYTAQRYAQWIGLKGSEKTELDHSGKNPSIGTVGAVAIDQDGNLAAATSTGGMTNKMFGRVGDSPIIGAGTYANNQSCAVSCTGHGEYFMREVVAYDVSCLMEYAGLTLEDACHRVIHEKLKNIGAEGGLIAIDREGNVVLQFNTTGMYRAWKRGGQGTGWAIF